MLPPAQPLPSTTFSTSQLSGEDRFEAWRASISVLFDVAPLAQGMPIEGFQAQVEAVHLGQLLLGDLRFGAQRFARSHARAAHDGLDHYLVQWYRQGGFIGQHADGDGLRVRSGDVVVFDMARTQHTVAQDSHVLSLIVPRALGDAAFAGAANPHGTVLRSDSVFGGLLADHLGALHRRLPAIGREQADDVVRATTQMLAACLRPSQRTLAEARAEVQAVTLERIQRHIARNLGAPLAPEQLCRTFGISRHRLYQLFEPLGGVARYVQQRRLQRAFQTWPRAWALPARPTSAAPSAPPSATRPATCAPWPRPPAPAAATRPRFPARPRWNTPTGCSGSERTPSQAPRERPVKAPGHGTRKIARGARPSTPNASIKIAVSACRIGAAGVFHA
jgi:hypothetical protein